MCQWVIRRAVSNNIIYESRIHITISPFIVVYLHLDFV